MSSSRTANAALKPLMHQFNYGASSSVPFRHSVFPAARQFFEENEFKWRILCTIAGVAMGAITVENMINDLEQFEMFEMGCRFCLACFCIVLVMLEWHEYLPNYFSVVIQEEVHILYTAYGRSGFYTLTGLLTLCSKRTINWAIGLLGAGVGAYVFLSAKYVDNELHNLLDARHIEDQTKRIFAEFDKNGNDNLEKSELYELLKKVYPAMTPAQREVAMFEMETNRDGVVSVDALVEWRKKNGKAFDNPKEFMNIGP